MHIYMQYSRKSGACASLAHAHVGRYHKLNLVRAWQRPVVVAVLWTAIAGALFGVQGLAMRDVVAAPVDGNAPSFADVVARVKPAVVNISVRAQAVTDGAGRGARPAPHRFPPGSPQERFFRRFFEGERARPHGFGYPHERRRTPHAERRASGSGFIIDAAGYVVTNHHVIKNATDITVVLHDGKELEASVHGSDKQSDLALLRVKADAPLPFVEFGDSDKARVGDWVIAIGNPFGLGGTTTSGIISARGRDIGASAFDDFIQVDAPINRGNSGGPLFNTKGKVIGVNTAIISPNGGNIGIGFAVPAKVAASVLADLRAGRIVQRGWLGVSVQKLSDDIAEALELDETRGALVSAVMPKSPATAAGLQVGDVILSYDSKDIKALRDLPRFVAQSKKGTRVRLEVWRDGKRRNLTVHIRSRDSAGDSGLALATTSELGMTLTAVDDDKRRRYRLGKKASGVIVTRVQPGSAAARRGIRPGDVIVRVARDKVRDAKTVSQAISKARTNNRESILLFIERGDDGLFVALPLA